MKTRFIDPEWKMSTEFYFWGNALRKTPGIGDTVSGWKIIAAWVNKKNWLKGYVGKCDRCGTIRPYIAVVAARDRTASKCKNCNKIRKSKSEVNKPSYRLASRYSTPNEIKKLIDEYGRESVQFVATRFYGMLTRGRSELHPGICDRWVEENKGFINFVNDCQHLPGLFEKTLVIDRIDTLGKYEPGNVRFTTVKMNNSNRINTNWVELENGGKISMTAWCELKNLPRRQVSKLYRNGVRKEVDILLAMDRPLAYNF